MDRTKRVELHVLPPAYQQMSGQANSELVTYLQAVALQDAT